METLITPQIISKETLMYLENNLVAAGRVNRKFENQFVKIGNTLIIRKPNKFRVASGPALQLQDISEPSVTITVNQQKHVDWQFSAVDLTLTVEEFNERYSKPAAMELANDIDYTVISNFSGVNNLVGTPGVTPATFAALGLVGQRMDEEAAPQEGRTLILNPAAYWTLANAFTGVFVQQVAEGALKGYLANIANFEIFMDQNVQSQTVGALGGVPTVLGAGQTGSNLITTGWTPGAANVLLPGDVFTIAGVFAVNPKSRASTGALRNFLVTGPVSANALGQAVVPIYPAITPFGAGVLGNPYQTVTASPVALAPITILDGVANTSYPQNLAFTRDAFGLVMVPMELFQGVDFAARETYKNISLRVMRVYDVFNDVAPTRIDCLYGTTTYYPELACRMTG